MQNSGKQKIRFYIEAIIIPIIVVSVIFMFLQVAPFGQNTFLISDLSTQYLQFFTELKRQLIHFNFSTYSFLISLGDGTVPIYSYYLLSPFNLIILLFKNAQLPIAINLIIWLKIILANISMTWFLSKKYQRYDLVAIAGGIAYGLCGFVAMYFYDLMWLDAVMMLPVIVYCLEQLFYRNRVWGYVAALTYTIITNYYMGYILCIFMLIYVGYLTLLNRKPELKFAQLIKDNRKQLVRFLWYSLISGVLSAVILIPTGIAMVTTGKGSFALKNFYLKGSFNFSAFANLGLGTNNFAGRLVHGPSLFCGSLFIIAVVVFFLAHQISRQSKLAAGISLAIICFAMWFRPLNTMWHMFQKPAGFPFRMVYVLSFFIVMIGFEAYVRGAFKDTHALITAGIITSIALTIGYGFANMFARKPEPFNFKIPQLFVSNWFLLISLVFIWLTILIMRNTISGPGPSGHLLLLVIAIEMSLNFLFATVGAQFVSEKKFANAYNSTSEIMRISNKDAYEKGQVYRSVVINDRMKNLYDIPYYGYNDSLIYSNRGISSYSSTLNSHTHHVLASLGFSTRNIRRIDMLGESAVTNRLLGIRDLVLIGKRDAKLIRNESVPPIGYMVSDDIQNIKFDKNMVFSNLNRLVQGESVTSHQFFQAPRSVKSFETDKNGIFHYRLTVEPNVSGPQYLYIPKVRLYGVGVTVNGQKLSKLYSGLGTEIIPLGIHDKNSKIHVMIKSQYELKGLASDFAGLDLPKYKSAVLNQKLSTFRFNDPDRININGSHFKGKIKVNQNNQTLLMSIPYDKGWHVRVNGKPADVIKVADGLIGIKLHSGKSQLQFDYRVEGATAGMIVSGIGVVMVLGSAGWRRKRRSM
ncbi:YfhO family protein [Lentilactobacillus sp. Marseille-Q4993]|uniref:YfhO family protein n=1 Tax=Lentilactobacillus sp. Marseille-Q4993 TaxID=3039492 RepID=UPI0024BC121C|nr:YfhO family protein [Lentilactobacillus sp. Marseille-Q4993]